MKISLTARNAILAVGYIAKNQKELSVNSQRIAKENDISLETLLKILQKLVRANVLVSKRGPGGGYWLGRSAKEITIVEIIEVIEGPMVGSLNLANRANGDKFAVKADLLIKKGLEKSRAALAKAKLADIMGK